MHILIGLAVATVIIILWAQGSLFACVFLSIPTGLGALILAVQDELTAPNHVAHALFCALLLLVIWAPRFYRGTRIRHA